MENADKNFGQIGKRKKDIKKCPRGVDVRSEISIKCFVTIESFFNILKVLYMYIHVGTSY